jgi:RimJ/RimL family protein N-acetyltransferase
MRDRDDDYARVVGWRNSPHVREWWDPDEPLLTMDRAVEEYRPGIGGAAPERLAVIEVAGVPVGLVQYYPWAAYREELAAMGLTIPAGAWGLDLFIGEPDRVDQGIGSKTVRLLCDYLMAEEGASAVALGVDRDNLRARRAYEKAGMTPSVEYLDTDIREGQRVRAVLMVRLAGAPARSRG